MAEMISKATKKIKNAASITAKKTRSAANIAKNTVQMRSLNHDLKRMYQKLGMALYNQVKLDEENDEIIASRIAEIYDVKCEIEKLAEEIKKEKAELSKKKNEPIEAEFQVVDDGDMPTE